MKITSFEFTRKIIAYYEAGNTTWNYEQILERKEYLISKIEEMLDAHRKGNWGEISQQDIEDDFTYDTEKLEAFYAPAGTVAEFYATTLHYAPCNGNDGGFKVIVVLPKGTNTDIEKADAVLGEDALLFARNKWLIAHPESGLDKDGAFIGLKGENKTV